MPFGPPGARSRCLHQPWRPNMNAFTAIVHGPEKNTGGALPKLTKILTPKFPEEGAQHLPQPLPRLPNPSQAAYNEAIKTHERREQEAAGRNADAIIGDLSGIPERSEWRSPSERSPTPPQTRPVPRPPPPPRPPGSPTPPPPPSPPARACPRAPQRRNSSHHR